MTDLKRGRKKQDIRFDFDRRVRVEFKAGTVSSDGGLLLYHELDGVPSLGGGPLLNTQVSTAHSR